MVQCVDSIGFTFVNYSSFIQEIVPVFEGYDFLLLVDIVALSHFDSLTILFVDIRDCIPDHVVREVDHESKLYLK